MSATAPPPLHKRAREPDETEKARDAKQRRVEPDAQAQSRVAAQPLAGKPTRNATTGATASTQHNSTAAAASRATRNQHNGTLAPSAPPDGPAPVVEIDMLAPPSSAAFGRAVAGRSGPKRVILTVRPPATTPIPPFDEPRAAQPALQSASSLKRPLAAVANDGDFDAQTVAVQRIADDRSALGEAFILKAPPARAQRPQARVADEDWCYCTICLRAMAVAAMAAEAMAAAAAASTSPPPPPPPMFQLGGYPSGLFAPVDDGEETTTEIGSENEEGIDVEYDAFFF